MYNEVELLVKELRDDIEGQPNTVYAWVGSRDLITEYCNIET